MRSPVRVVHVGLMALLVGAMACQPSTLTTKQFAADVGALRGDALAEDATGSGQVALADASAPETALCPTTCDDQNGCTLDSCSQPGNCAHLALDATPCDDGDACTAGEACAAGTCQGGTPVVCEDNNPCTDNTCAKGSGCAVSNNTAPCDDKSACTGPDACADGKCQGVKHIWQANLGSKYSDKGRAVVALPDGGVAVAGAWAGNVQEDFWLVRFDALGQVVWDKTYGAPKVAETARAVARTSDGGFLVAGSSAANQGDAMLVRTGPDGAVSWTNSYGGAGVDEARDVVSLSNGGAAFVGHSPDPGGVSHLWFVRIDAAGKTLASALITTDGAEYGEALAAMPGGGFVLVGRTTVSTSMDGMAVRVDDSGAELWRKIYVDPNTTETLLDVAVVPGGLALVGSVQGSDGGTFDIVVRRLDSAGTELWKKTYGDAGADTGTAIALIPEGLLVAGSRTPPGATAGDGLLMRLDPNGQKLWQRTIEAGPETGSLIGLQWLGNGAVVVGSAPDPVGSSGMWVVRTDTNGYADCTWSGACAKLPCGDNDPCTSNWCDVASGCQKVVIGDGAWCGPNACQVGVCSNQQCQGLKAVDCDDGNDCSVDSCSLAAGCKHALAGDGTPCGVGSFCKNGSCGGQ